MTGQADGDLSAALAARGDIAWARQVHGTSVLQVDAGGCAGEADVLVTTRPGLRLAVRAADCGPLALWAADDRGPSGAAERRPWRPCLAVAHVGWRGARDGVVAAAASAVRRLSGADEVHGWLGPCIGPCCYEFGEADLADLADLAARLGGAVRATTAGGRPGLDLPAMIGLAAGAAGVLLTGVDGRCTACHVDGDGNPTLFSHRARGEIERHGVLACLR